MAINGGNLVTTAIITNGLFCAPVERSGIITTFFSLYVENPPTFQDSGGGGPYPGNAWNVIPDIQNFYKPVPTEEWQFKRLEDVNLRKSKHVVLKVKIGETEHVKEFIVKEKVAGAIAKIGDVYETTKQKIAVKITNVNSFVKKLSVKINKIRVFVSKD